MAGRKIAVASVQVETAVRQRAAAKPADAEPPPPNGKRDLKAEAMSSAAVQAVLDVFPGEIKDVEELSMNIMDMMRQAKEMQERLQQQMAEVRVEATAGGGMVTVVMNGAKQVQSLVIDPTVVSKDDVEMLQDMIVAALNDAQRKVDERLSQSMSGLMGGLKIPGLS